MQNIQSAIAENRRIAHELVAPDFSTLRLLDLLHSLTDNMLKNSGIDVVVDANVLNENLLTDQQKLTIYRIVQEQCTNIVKYAEAKSVKISLGMADNFFKMIIADDGKGLEAGKITTGIGLRNIKSRLSLFSGTLDICSAKGKGFVLEIVIPLNQ